MRKITRRTGWLVLFLLYCLVVFCTEAKADSRKDLEDNLRKLYEHKLLSFRTPYAANKLQFDSQGKVVGAAVSCPWSTCGLMQVEQMALASGRVEISGKRVILALRARTTPASQTDTEVIPLATERGIRVRIDLPASSLDTAQVNQALSTVFERGELLPRVAAYWKPKVDLGGVDLVSQMKVLHDRAPNSIVAELEGGRPVYLVNPGVVEPPKPIHTPDPEYTESARQKRLEGTTIVLVVVNEKGFPEILEITRGLGEGLDLRALTAVAGWTFKPATRNGEPVAVLIDVQVAFRLR